MTRKCFFPLQEKEVADCWGLELGAVRCAQYAAITVSALEGFDGEPLPPIPGSEGGA